MRALAKLRRLKPTDLALLVLAILVFAALVSLGNWQMDRRDWKVSLIEAIETRAYGDPIPVPLDGDPLAKAYLRVTAEGRFQPDLLRRVKAVSGMGPGHWLMVPLRTNDGHIWINRGFVPSGSNREDWTPAEGVQTIEGLMRVSEPNGTFFESNDAVASRWVSRDVEALSKDVGLQDVAPFFIDATHTGPPLAWPRGSLTKLSFRNSHLAYALTWYAMAALLLLGLLYAVNSDARGETE